jgi:hypothetical protein
MNWKITQSVIESQTVYSRSAESIGALADHLDFTIKAGYTGYSDPEFEIVRDVLFVVPEHPGELSHRL